MLPKLQGLLEKTFRRSAMWAYALNQSRAKIVMDPIYLAVAKRLLRDTSGPSTKLLSEKFPENLYFPYRAQSRKLAVLHRGLGLDARRGPICSRSGSAR